MSRGTLSRRRLLQFGASHAALSMAGRAMAEPPSARVHTLDLVDGLAFSWSDGAVNFAACVRRKGLEVTFTGETIYIANADLMLAVSAEAAEPDQGDALLAFAHQRHAGYLDSPLMDAEIELQVLLDYIGSDGRRWLHWEMAYAPDAVLPAGMLTARHMNFSTLSRGAVVNFELLLRAQDDVASFKEVLRQAADSFVESGAPVDLPALFQSTGRGRMA